VDDRPLGDLLLLCWRPIKKYYLIGYLSISPSYHPLTAKILRTPGTKLAMEFVSRAAPLSASNKSRIKQHTLCHPPGGGHIGTFRSQLQRRVYCFAGIWHTDNSMSILCRLENNLTNNVTSLHRLQWQHLHGQQTVRHWGLSGVHTDSKRQPALSTAGG